MRAVLYAHDMEPITILEVKDWMRQYLESHREVRLPVYDAPLLDARPSGPGRLEYRVVRITAETFKRNGEAHMMLFTHDEENSMLLKSAFLPGQRSSLKYLERAAFAKGFLAAFATFGE